MNNEKNEKFNRLLSAIRNEQVDDKLVSQAGGRVWNSITGTPLADVSPHKLRNCEDFQALIPQYLGKQLAGARGLLFEDHMHACVACRHAVERARSGEQQAVWRPATELRSFPVWRWAMSAGAVAIVAVIALALSLGIFPGQQVVRGVVQNVDGSLYAVTGDTVRIVPAGYEIRSGDEIRTAKGASAMVRLVDGSLVEMRERADISLSHEWKGNTIHLDGGQVIVQAAKQRTGRLYVATGDCLVSVKGTIFSVNRGIKGSRVAVIQGLVRVDYGDRTSELHAGDEVTSSANVSTNSIQNEIAWSRNAAKYLALLGDFAVLQKQLAAIPGAGLRYSSDLVSYVPDDTVVYVAIPNLATTLGQASQIFQERLQQSPALRQWWHQQQKSSGPKIEDVMDQLKTFSSYLGDEIVFAVGKNGSVYGAPVVLARVRQPGLEAFLQRENRQLSAKGSRPALQIVRNPWATPSASRQSILVYVKDDLLMASPDVAELQRASSRVQQSSPGHFAETPLYQQIVRSYQQGAGWLLCADMEQIVAHNVQSGSNHDLPPGIGDVRYLTMEHREVGGKTDNRADLTFAAERQGVASWLAAPASMGSLEFVSPEASMVTSAVIRNPRSIMEGLFQMLGSGDTNFSRHLSEFEAKTGVSVLDDLAAPLGGEVTMAFDGPMLPTPRWKLIFEVYDPTTLQATIAKLVDSYNREGSAQGRSLQLTKRQVGSQTYFAITNSQHTDEVDYTFVDSYLIAAPDRGTLSRAIQSRQAGYTLTHAPTFQALLPSDGYTNFSAIFYHNIGPVVGPIAEQLKSSGALTSQQQHSIDSLTANSAPGLIYAYGEPDRIVVASNTGFMGFDLGTLLTMGDNGPFLPQMLLGRALSNPGNRVPRTQSQ
ncbi:MAG TPA: FecR domain-containing protein [Terriglobales bacterium]|nr:FecR domain-containing protein [Terriglobales bacterium]